MLVLFHDVFGCRREERSIWIQLKNLETFRLIVKDLKNISVIKWNRELSSIGVENYVLNRGIQLPPA